MKFTKKDNFLILDKQLKIVLNDITIPFGIEKYYTDYTCKLSLNTENYNMFKNIENSIREELLEIDSEYELKSQINESRNFKTLTAKLFSVKNNIVTEIIDEESKIIGMDEIAKKQKINIIIFFDKMWLKNNIAYYKWKIIFIKKEKK